MAGNEIAVGMLEELNLPPLTVGFELRAYVQEMVKIRCEYYPDANSVKTVLEEFQVVRRVRGNPAIADHSLRRIVYESGRREITTDMARQAAIERSRWQSCHS